MRKMLSMTRKSWPLTGTLGGVLFALLVMLGMVVLGGHEGLDLHRFLALLPLLVGAGSLAALVMDDGEEEDETAKTIVAMPAWMSEELQKEKARIESERAVQKDVAKAAAREKSPEASELAFVVDNSPAEVSTSEVEEAPEIARTMAFDPSEAAAFREMTMKSSSDHEAASEPESPDEPLPEPAAPVTAQTMAFNPAEAEAFKAQVQPVNEPVAPEEDMGMAATVMFDAREAGFDKMVVEKPSPPPASVDEVESDETGAYTAEDVARLKGMIGKGREATPEAEAMAGTMAYMPAMSQEMAPARESVPATDDGGARTMAYMPAVDGGDSTMAYSPEDKQRILDAMQQGQSPADALEAIGSTQAYSPDQSAALREAFDLLDQARSGASGNSSLAAEAKELLANAPQTDPGVLRQQAQELLSRTGETEVPDSRPTHGSSSPSLTEGLGAEGKGGMSTVSLIVVLLLLLALAGGATAFILHFLGVINLPVGLPQLDLFKG